MRAHAARTLRAIRPPPCAQPTPRPRMATLSYHFDAAPSRLPVHARRIAIFGASGATGSYAVRHALAAGFHVTAIVRDPQRLPLRHPALRSRETSAMPIRALPIASATIVTLTPAAARSTSASANRLAMVPPWKM